MTPSGTGRSDRGSQAAGLRVIASGLGYLVDPNPGISANRAGRRIGSEVVVDDFDVVPVGVQDERAVVARVVDGALAGTAVVLVSRGERGGVERPDGRVVLRREREVDVLRERSLVVDQREARTSLTIWTWSESSTPIRSPACGAIVV